MKELIKRYPELFQHINLEATLIPHGWIPCITALCGSIDSYMNNIDKMNPFMTVEPVSIMYIHEKKGELRFSYAGGDDVIEGMVELAIYMCSYTCMECGNPGELIHKDSCWNILCDKCNCDEE